MARLSKIKTPNRPDVAASTKPEAFDRWNAGIHAAEGDDAPDTITIYDTIGYDYWTGGGVTVNRIDAALRKIGATKPVTVHVNSPGGDMFEGIAIYNRLQEHKGDVTVKVMGLAASAASLIAMAGDDLQMGAGTFLMIHNCWVLAMGDRSEMEATARFLAPFDAAMASLYAARSGQDIETITGWMDEEKWIGGDEAVALGFANSVLSPDATKEDKKASALAREVNAIRQAELGLCKTMSRSEARSLLAKIKGTHDASRDDDMPGAVTPDLVAACGDLHALFR